jgi:hypothetical protein
MFNGYNDVAAAVRGHGSEEVLLDHGLNPTPKQLSLVKSLIFLLALCPFVRMVC